MSNFIYIGKEGFRVENEKHFASILEEKLGYDAAELFGGYIRRYHYAIEEALEALDKVKSESDKNRTAIEEAMDALEGVMW